MSLDQKKFFRAAVRHGRRGTFVAAVFLSSFARAQTATNLVPSMKSRSATCDLAFMDEFYAELKGGVCLSGGLLEADCVKFNAVEAATFLPFSMGLGKVAGLLGLGASGLSAKDGYIEEETAEQALGRNRLAQNGVSCKEPYQAYVHTQLDYQVRLGEFERPDDDDDKPLSKQAQAARQADLKWWCQPYYGRNNTALSRRNIEFLQLPEAKRRELLCQNPELREYYERLMEPYTERLRRQTQITGLKCDADGQGLTFVVSNGGKKTTFATKMSNLGNFAEVMASPAKPADSVAWVEWQKALEVDAKMGRSHVAKSFQVSNRPSELVPGRSLFHFRDTNSGAQLSEVSLINASGAMPGANWLVATIGSDQLERVVRKQAKTHPMAELDQLQKNYHMFNLRANEAKDCCHEKDGKKKSACLKQMDSDHLTVAAPAATPTAPRVPPASSRRSNQR